MCGIAGVVGRDAPPGREVLERMVGAIRHRGPDAEGCLVVGNVGLAHARLALLGLGECGAQPMSDAEGRWHLTYNGEIFNHVALRERLAKGAEFRGGSDSETLLRCLAEWGVAATLSELDGFFAFAALDREAGVLHLVRDPFGVKPLYFGRSGERFLFASEAKAMFAAGFPCEPDADVLRQHLVHRWCHGRDTPFVGVSKLLPGERLELDLDTLEEKIVEWCPLGDWVDPGLAEDLAAMRDDDLADLLAGKLRSAARGRMLADVPVATLCSGGVDSSLITAFAAEGREALQAFMIQPLDDPDSDEGPYAQQVCDRVGAQLNRVPFDSVRWRRAFLETAPFLENPLWIEPTMGSSVVAEDITAAGFKAALGGDAADELFGGYDDRYPAERQAFADEIGRTLPVPTLDFERMPPESDTSKALRHPGEPPECERVYLEAQLAAAREAFAHHQGARRELEALMFAETRMHMAIAFDQIDKATMRSSLEYREPFLDRELVLLAVNLPLESKLWPKTKAILRTVGARLLPEDVLARKKIGFTYNTDGLFEGKVRPSFYENTMLEELFGVANKKIAKWFEPGRGRATFRICSAEIWMRHFIGGQSVGEVGEALWVD